MEEADDIEDGNSTRDHATKQFLESVKPIFYEQISNCWYHRSSNHRTARHQQETCRDAQNIYKIEELRKRILFTLGLLLIYRLGSFVVLPGVNHEALKAFTERSLPARMPTTSWVC